MGVWRSITKGVLCWRRELTLPFQTMTAFPDQAELQLLLTTVKRRMPDVRQVTFLSWLVPQRKPLTPCSSPGLELYLWCSVRTCRFLCLSRQRRLLLSTARDGTAGGAPWSRVKPHVTSVPWAAGSCFPLLNSSQLLPVHQFFRLPAFCWLATRWKGWGWPNGFKQRPHQQN